MSKLKYLHVTALLMLCVFVMAGAALAADSWKVVKTVNADALNTQLYSYPKSLLWDQTGSVVVQTENNGTTNADIWDVGWNLVSVEGPTLSATAIDRWGVAEIPVPGPVERTGYYGGTGSNLLRGQFDFRSGIKAPPITGLTYATLSAAPAVATFDCKWQLADDTDALLDTDIAVTVAGTTLASGLKGITVGPFSDCLPTKAGAWAAAYIAELAGRVPAIVGGFGGGLYNPTVKVDRAAMAVYLARALNLDLPTYQGYFVDVTIGHWARPWIEAMKQTGLVGGFDPTHYRPSVIVNRDAMAVFVARAMVGSTTVASGPATGHFTDVPDATPGPANWAYDEIEYCYAQGVVGGYTATLYRPTVPVTRDQMAVFVYRAFMTPTATVVLAGPAVTAVDITAPTYDGWSSSAIAEADAPGTAYIALDAVRLDPAMPDFDVKFELRLADEPGEEATGDYTGTDTITGGEITAAQGDPTVPYLYAKWQIPTGLAEAEYVLVATVDGTVLTRKPAFEIGEIIPPDPPEELAIYPTTRSTPQPFDSGVTIVSGSYADLRADDGDYLVINSNDLGQAGYQVYCMFDTEVTASTMQKVQLDVNAMSSIDDGELLQIRTGGRNALNLPVATIDTFPDADTEYSATWASSGKRKIADCFRVAGQGIVTLYGYPIGTGAENADYDLSIEMIKYTATLR